MYTLEETTEACPRSSFTNAGSLVVNATSEAKLWRSMCGRARNPTLADRRTNSCSTESADNARPSGDRTVDQHVVALGRLHDPVTLGAIHV